MTSYTEKKTGRIERKKKVENSKKLVLAIAVSALAQCGEHTAISDQLSILLCVLCGYSFLSYSPTLITNASTPAERSLLRVSSSF
jgi:hypothetical protein